MMSRRRRSPYVLVVTVAAVAAFMAMLPPPSSSAQGLGVVFQSPAPGATVGGGVAVQFESFGGADPGGDFVVQRHFVLAVDKAVVLDTTPTLPFNHQEGIYFWPSTELADGPHLFELKVTDEAGATATAVMALGALNHPSGVGAANGGSLTAAVLTSAPAGSLSGVVAVAVRADSAAGGAGATLTLALDGTQLATQAVVCHDGSCMWSWVWDTKSVPDGAHTLKATATGSTGGTATGTLSVTVVNGGGAASQKVVWTTPVNVAVSGNTITKNGGCSGCADAGAASQQAIPSGHGAAQFAVASGTQGTVGLSVGNPGTSGSEIMFGLRFYAGYVEVREGGAYKADWPLTAGAIHKIAVESGAVKYYQAGALKYTSTKAPIYPLLLDASVNNVGGSVQNAIMTTSGGGGGSPGDTTAPSVTISAPANGSTVSGTLAVTATASDNAGVASVQFKVDGGNVGSADTGAPYSVSWNTTSVANGTHVLTAVARDAAGNTRTSAPVTVTVSNGGSGPGTPQNVTWTSVVNAAVSGNTITKNAGCSGCGDAGAVSQQLIVSGNGSMTFSVSSGAELTVGLGSGNSGTGGADVDFGLRFYPSGYVEVRESGAYKWDFAIVAGASYKVAVENGIVKYYQNGALRYTSAKAPTFPLLLDASLNGLGAAVQNAVVGP